MANPLAGKTPTDDEDRDHLFFGVLGSAVDAARLGGLHVRLALEDGTEVTGVPAESPLSEGRNLTEIDHSGVRADLVLSDTVVMMRRVRGFAIDRPAGEG